MADHFNGFLLKIDHHRDRSIPMNVEVEIVKINP